MIFEDLTKVFDSALKQFEIDNSILACIENIDCPTTTATPYLSGFMIPALVEQADFTVNEFRTGIYQIDINYASHLGSAPINKMADLLNAALYTGLYLTRNDICVGIDSVDLGPLIVAGGWAKRPLSINWQSYTTRI